jgi:hypothetical protein
MTLTTIPLNFSFFYQAFRISKTFLSGLKVAKCDNFGIMFFTLINHIWVCDLGTGKKLFIFKAEARIRLFVFSEKGLLLQFV